MRRRRQSNKGQAIAEGVAALALIVAAVVGGVLLLIGVGTAVYYKQKILYAAQTGATCGTWAAEWMGQPRSDFSPAKLQSDVTEIVNLALTKVGLPRASSVEVADEIVGSQRVLTVTVSVNALPIVSGGVLPSSISLVEKAATVFPDTQPNATANLSFGPAGPGLNNLGNGTIGVPAYAPSPWFDLRRSYTHVSAYISGGTYNGAVFQERGQSNAVAAMP